VAFESLRTGAMKQDPLSLFSHKRESGMFERCLHTDWLDAAMGVKETETGYRDNWRIWLADAASAEFSVVCRLLKKRELPGG